MFPPALIILHPFFRPPLPKVIRSLTCDSRADVVYSVEPQQTQNIMYAFFPCISHDYNIFIPVPNPYQSSTSLNSTKPCRASIHKMWHSIQTLPNHDPVFPIMLSQNYSLFYPLQCFPLRLLFPRYRPKEFGKKLPSSI